METRGLWIVVVRNPVTGALISQEVYATREAASYAAREADEFFMGESDVAMYPAYLRVAGPSN